MTWRGIVLPLGWRNPAAHTHKEAPVDDELFRGMRNLLAVIGFAYVASIVIARFTYLYL